MIWKLRELTVSVPGEKVAPAMQFCHAPGDVTKFKLLSATRAHERAEKRLANTQKRLAETGQNRADPTQTLRLRHDLSKQETELAEARSMEHNAQESERTVERLTVDAADAMVLASAG